MAGTYDRPDGLTEAEWREFQRDIEKTEEGLLSRVCPDCGSTLSKKLDPAPDTPGLWFNYRCQNDACDFAVDQKEAN